MSIAQVLGQFVFGYMSDKQISVSALATICSVISTIATFALWGFAKSLGLLIVFSILYGFFGYGFGTMRVAMGRTVSDDPSAAVVTYSLLVFVQGIGNILVGPISAGLLSPKFRLGDYGVSRYKDLVIFTGTCMFVSALIIGGWHFQRLYRSLV
jgi:MFS family permease